MGPDTDELVRRDLIQRVEDEFKISISDEEAQRARTAGELHRLVLRKLVEDGSSRALFVTQRALASEFGVERRELDSRTPLEPFLPLPDRADRWNRISRRACVRFPQLRHPRQLNDRIMLASIAISAIPVIAVWWSLYALDWIRGIGVWLFSIPAAFAFLLLESRVDKDLLRWTWRRATEIPFKTVGELADAVLAMNVSLFQSGFGNAQAISSTLAWEKIVELIRQAGAQDCGRIVPGATLPELLKVN